MILPAIRPTVTNLASHAAALARAGLDSWASEGAHASGARVIVTGSVPIDWALSVPYIPTSGGDVFASAGECIPGGALNVAEAVRRFATPAVLTSTIASDTTGDAVRVACAAAGIAIAGVAAAISVTQIGPRTCPTRAECAAVISSAAAN